MMKHLGMCLKITETQIPMVACSAFVSHSHRRHGEQQEGLPDDPDKGGGGPSEQQLLERQLRRRFRPGSQLQSDGVSICQP